MHPLWLIPCGFVVLALFCFGGSVAGGGDRAHVASAARAFAGRWMLMCLGNLWVRWWDGVRGVAEYALYLPAMLIPILGAFLVWRWLRAG